ncbi:hypothetical protein BCR42DRAFT_50718 [Absidia repens]|uniref:Transcription factor domain-containing protein n=1 Tax=Absidia repens TaxID=90262 RepID=A0A1X2IEX4_9FUNG|nr:hypothetical protein BCR42DRAFT_50718 [Absidia repens]
MIMEITLLPMETRVVIYSYSLFCPIVYNLLQNSLLSSIVILWLHRLFKCDSGIIFSHLSFLSPPFPTLFYYYYFLLLLLHSTPLPLFHHFFLYLLMPFDTLGRFEKRLRSETAGVTDDLDHLSFSPLVDPFLPWSSSISEQSSPTPRSCTLLSENLDIQTTPSIYKDPRAKNNSMTFDSQHHHFIKDDPEKNGGSSDELNFPQQTSAVLSPSLSSCSSTTMALPVTPLTITDQQTAFSLDPPWPPILPTLDVETLHAALSRFRLSYTDTGINMEANISTASEFRSLLDAFGKLSCTNLSTSAIHDPFPSASNNSDNDDTNKGMPLSSRRRNSVVLYRNKSCKSVPVNYVQMVGLLGQILHPHSSHHGIMTLRQIADTCVDAYFTCWIRYTPVLQRQEFMKWYLQHDAPQDTLIVNALCSLIFRHAVTHHCSPGLNHFLHDPDRMLEQEEFYFRRARDALAHSFDTPDRFMVIALTFLCVRAEPSRRHHYGGLAISLLQQLNIYPRMVGGPTTTHSDDDFGRIGMTDHSDDDMDDDDEETAYAKEMDTRLWWFVWQIDFSHWSAGLPKITPLLRLPNQRYEDVDFPMVFEQDIDQAEMAILTESYTLTFWRTQADIISTMYEQESELTSEQLADFDERLMDIYSRVPACMKMIDAPTSKADDVGCKPFTHDSSNDMELAKTRVKLEYNASRIILHRLFIPDVGDLRPSKTALESLNICLKVALEQLDILGNCIRSSTRCAFDLFELWRVGQILSMAMDIHRTIKNHKSMMQGISIGDGNNSLLFLEQQLQRTTSVLASTPEGIIGTKSWTEVAHFLHGEIRRHGSLSAVGTKKKTSSSTQLDSVMTQQQQMGQKPLTGLSSPSLSIISFASPATPSTLSALPFASSSSSSNKKKSSIQQRKSSSSSSVSSSSTATRLPSSKQTFVQATSATFDGKDQPRFRYFNPRKMNKFLFIDESR